MSHSIDPQTGVPILGARNPEADKRAYIEAIAAEKRALGQLDHDWIVLLAYALTEHDADRAATAKETGVSANPPIPVIAETMVDDIGPLCRRCNQTYTAVKDSPCPGMPFEVYLASLPEDVRNQVLERLQSGDMPNDLRFDEETGQLLSPATDDSTATDEPIPSTVTPPGVG